jgi:hypothetical protein
MRTSLLAGAVVLGLAAAVATPVLGAAVGGTPAASSRSQSSGAQPSLSLAAASLEPPSADVIFNDPTGDPAAKNRIADHVRRAIDATPRHGSIRMAAYSFDLPEIAGALLRACTQRQVTVQVVLNDNFVSRPARQLQQALGADTDSSEASCGAGAGTSFVKVCHASCRLGDRGNQHMKIYLFSATGSESYVVMAGSANLTGYAAGVHWNDLVTFTGSQQLYDDYSRVFAELASDQRVESPAVEVRHGDLLTSVAAGRPATPDEDAVAQRLGKVDCRALPGSGVGGRTVVRVSMYGWQGERGLDLARRTAELSREGCRVQVLVSAAGPDVVATLLDSEVQVRSASLDVDHDVTTGFEDSGWEHFVHEKWMSLDGTWDGAATRAVWTGSENWSDVSLLNDELVVMIPREQVHAAYVAHFDHIWGGYSKEIEPSVSEGSASPR